MKNKIKIFYFLFPRLTYLSYICITKPNNMNTLIVISTQYHDENGKPKGLQVFNLRAESDLFMYCKDECIATIQDMLDEIDLKWAGKHTYISHELIFHEPISLDGGKFFTQVTEKLNTVKS